MSHRAAAALFDLPGFDLPGGSAGLVEIGVRRGMHRRHPGLIIHETAPFPNVDTTRVDAIPVTTVTRTLIDLGAVVSKDAVEEALDDALRRRLTSIRWLQRRIEALATPGRRGIRVIRELVDARSRNGGAPENRFERRVLRLIRNAGIPDPECQYEVWDEGLLIARPDFAYPQVKLAIEADGYAAHSVLSDWARDRKKGNDLELIGWGVLRFTWRDVRDRPGSVAAQVRRALARRGYAVRGSGASGSMP